VRGRDIVRVGGGKEEGKRKGGKGKVSDPLLIPLTDRLLCLAYLIGRIEAENKKKRDEERERKGRERGAELPLLPSSTLILFLLYRRPPARRREGKRGRGGKKKKKERADRLSTTMVSS